MFVYVGIYHLYSGCWLDWWTGGLTRCPSVCFLYIDFCTGELFEQWGDIKLHIKGLGYDNFKCFWMVPYYDDNKIYWTEAVPLAFLESEE